MRGGTPSNAGGAASRSTSRGSRRPRSAASHGGRVRLYSSASGTRPEAHARGVWRRRPLRDRRNTVPATLPLCAVGASDKVDHLNEVRLWSSESLAPTLRRAHRSRRRNQGPRSVPRRRKRPTPTHARSHTEGCARLPSHSARVRPPCGAAPPWPGGKPGDGSAREGPGRWLVLPSLGCGLLKTQMRDGTPSDAGGAASRSTSRGSRRPM